MSERLNEDDVSVQLSVLVPLSLRQQLNDVHLRSGAPKSVIIRRALEAYFKKEGRETKPGAKPMNTKETRDYARKHRKR